MAYTRPFRTSRWIAHAGDSRPRRLRLAVQPTDTFTGQPVRVPLRVAIQELPRLKPTLNPSGFYCFHDFEAAAGNPGTVPDGDYTLVVEPDPLRADWYFLEPEPGGSWTFAFTRPVTLPLPDPRHPVLPLRLAPNPDYPFPGQATLIRGAVFREGNGPGAALPGVTLRTTYDRTDPNDPGASVPRTLETQSDRRGQFVLFFTALPAATQEVSVQAALTDPPIHQPTTIREGRTTHNVILRIPS